MAWMYRSRMLSPVSFAAATSSFDAGLKPKVVEATGGTERADGNNVDIDAEMGNLNKNTLLFNAYAQILANKIAVMRSAITGR